MIKEFRKLMRFEFNNGCVEVSSYHSDCRKYRHIGFYVNPYSISLGDDGDGFWEYHIRHGELNSLRGDYSEEDLLRDEVEANVRYEAMLIERSLARPVDVEVTQPKSKRI